MNTVTPERQSSLKVTQEPRQKRNPLTPRLKVTSPITEWIRDLIMYNYKVWSHYMALSVSEIDLCDFLHQQGSGTALHETNNSTQGKHGQLLTHDVNSAGPLSTQLRSCPMVTTAL